MDRAILDGTVEVQVDALHDVRFSCRFPVMHPFS